MTRLRFWMLLIVAGFVANVACCQPPGSRPQPPIPGALKTAPAPRPIPDASDKLFAGETISKLKIVISQPELQKLRDDNRAYVRCNVIENGTVTYKDVALKLKGAAGSFREIDDHPALTLNMDRLAAGQTFHDLEKLHLNNSVQDESYLNELLCAELFRDAGLPAPRVAHARVWLNGRDLGLYVLKEGFDKRFLKRHFANATGNLYEGGFVQDIDADLEKDSGKDPEDRTDLRALRDACAEPDPATRWKRLAACMDIDKFIDFMALELLTCHWDGYSLNKNNYRLYFDPQTRRAHFLPHGMDQMFGDPAASVIDHPGAMVSSAVMLNPEWRKQYRLRLKQLLPLFDPPTRLQQRADTVARRLRPVLKAISEDQATAFNDRVAEVKQRLLDRAASLREQVELPEPGPIEFNDEGFADLPDWYAASESEDALHEELELPGPRLTYSIKCGPSGVCVASWRRKVLLDRGRYQLLAQAKTDKLAPQSDEKGSGVGLRISGANRTNTFPGTSNWKPLDFEFEVVEELREVELVAEIRATAGQVWFARDSLRLKRLSQK